MADHWLGISSTEYNSGCGDYGSETVENALDGTSQWRHDENHIHWFVIDLGSTYTIKKVRGRSDSQYGRDPDDVNIYIDDSNPPTTLCEEGITTWVDTANWVEITLTTEGTGRYIKVEIESTQVGDNNLMFGRLPSTFTIFDAFGDVAGGIGTHTPSDTAKASDSVTFIARTVISDNAKGSDDITIKPNISLSETAKANDNVVITAKPSIEDTAKGNDSIGFIKDHKENISDNAKASDGIGFIKDKLISLSDIAKGSDSLTLKPQIPIQDTSKANDSLTIGVISVLGDTAKASDSLTTRAMPSLGDIAKASDSLISKAFSTILDTAKSLDIFSPDQFSITDIAKAIDNVVYRYIRISDILKYPLKKIKDKIQRDIAETLGEQKYSGKKEIKGDTAEVSNMQKYRSRKDRGKNIGEASGGQKYRSKKDNRKHSIEKDD